MRVVGVSGVIAAAVVLLATGCPGGGGSKADAAGAESPSPTAATAPSGDSVSPGGVPGSSPSGSGSGTGSLSSSAAPVSSSSSRPSATPGSKLVSVSGGTPSSGGASPSFSTKGLVVMPPSGVKWDYQIGGAYPPPAGVGIVSRDRSAAPAPGLYNICYVNAFQAQPDATDWWRANHPDLLLKTASGAPVIDENWNEQLLDVSTDAKRAALAKIVGGWFDDCQAKGFQAVEPDNLDSYSRSQGLLTADQDAVMATEFARLAHAKGLAIAQKNTTEFLPRAKTIVFDFAVTEQCGDYDECAKYAAVYGSKVVDVEYDDKGFSAACRAYAGRIAIVRRDLDVSAAGGSSYVYKNC